MSTIVSGQRRRYRAKLLRPNPEVVTCANSSQVRRLIYMAMNPGRSLPSRHMLKRYASIALVLALIGLTSAIALSLTSYKNSVSAQKPVYVTTKVLRKMEACTKSLPLMGLIVPTKRSEMGFTRAGRLKHLHVIEGDCVEAGTLLAELDSSSLQAELLVAKSELKLAERRSKTLPMNPLTSIKHSRIYGSESVPGTHESQAARTLVEHWNSVVKQLEVQLEECQLRAPYKAKVSRTYLSDGSVITPDRPVVNVISCDELVARIPIPAEQVENLSDLASYALTVGKHTLIGNLKTVLPDIDPSRQTCDAIFVLPELTSANVGSQVRLSLEVPTQTTGFRIPKTAARRAADGTTTVSVISKSPSPQSQRNRKPKVTQQRIEVLQVTEDSLIVRGDVKVGDRIVAEQPNRLANGQEVWYSDRMQWLNECWPD